MSSMSTRMDTQDLQMRFAFHIGYILFEDLNLEVSLMPVLFIGKAKKMFLVYDVYLFI